MTRARRCDEWLSLRTRPCWLCCAHELAPVPFILAPCHRSFSTPPPHALPQSCRSSASWSRRPRSSRSASAHRVRPAPAQIDVPRALTCRALPRPQSAGASAPRAVACAPRRWCRLLPAPRRSGRRQCSCGCHQPAATARAGPPRASAGRPRAPAPAHCRRCPCRCHSRCPGRCPRRARSSCLAAHTRAEAVSG